MEATAFSEAELHQATAYYAGLRMPASRTRVIETAQVPRTRVDFYRCLCPVAVSNRSANASSKPRRTLPIRRCAMNEPASSHGCLRAAWRMARSWARLHDGLRRLPWRGSAWGGKHPAIGGALADLPAAPAGEVLARPPR